MTEADAKRLVVELNASFKPLYDELLDRVDNAERLVVELRAQLEYVIRMNRLDQLRAF